jgi:hypothetical protein
MNHFDQEKASNRAQDQSGEDFAPPVLPWLRATLDDLNDFDFEGPVATSQSADSMELSDLFRVAAGPVGEKTELPDTPSAHIFAMLWAVTGMHFKPREPNEPFGAAFVAPDGRRSALPADFRGPPINVLAQMAERAKHPVLRARLADVSWLLDRKRGALAADATVAYVDVVKKVDSGCLKFRFDKDRGALKYDACDLLRRALMIGRAIGMEKPGPTAAREMVARLRTRALEKSLPIAMDWFGHLDLDFRISDPIGVGKDVEELIAVLPVETDPHSIVELWRLATRAYHLAKRDDDKYRAQSASAEQLVSMSKQQPSAMLASHLLAEAISELHGVPGNKDRRRQLNHLLVDVQAGIADEMSPFSMPLDLGDLIRQTEQRVQYPSLRDKLFVFAALTHSPDPAQLIDQAAKSIREHPLSSLFEASYHDREGKVVHRSEGAGGWGRHGRFGNSAADSAGRKHPAPNHGVRRNRSRPTGYHYSSLCRRRPVHVPSRPQSICAQ